MQRSHLVRYAFSVGLLFAVAACGDGGGQSGPSEASRAALARVLKAPEDHPIWAGSVGAEVADLIRLRRFTEIQFVDAELRRKGDVVRRRAVHHTLAASSGNPEVVALLRGLAARDPDALLLAPFREGGVAHLLGFLEDESASVDDRMTSARLLGECAGMNEVRRMEALSERTEEKALEESNEPLGGPPETLGSVVRESLQKIRARVGAQGGRWPTDRASAPP